MQYISLKMAWLNELHADRKLLWFMMLTLKSNLQSFQLMQAAGKYRQEGKTYVVQDGDIIFFKFNVSGGGKK